MSTIEFTGKTTVLPFEVDVDGHTYSFSADDNECPSAEIHNDEHVAILVSAGCYRVRPGAAESAQPAADRPARPRKAA